MRTTLSPFLLLHACLAITAAAAAAAYDPSPSASPAPGGFTPKGELPQLEFARLGAYRFASSSLCLRTKRACYVMCARKHQQWQQSAAVSTLREEGTSAAASGSGIHLVSPGIGCLCQGQDGDVLAQIGLLRREAERYLHAFGHPITARLLAYRLGAILGGKGQETWSRPPCCISVIMSAKATGRGAEMYQVDPTGLVLSVRGQAFGGGNAEDPVAHEAQAWLADLLNNEKEEEGEEEDEKAIWTKLWRGMQKHFPAAVAKHPEWIDCAKASASTFTSVGTIDKVLGTTTSTTTTAAPR